MPFVDFVSKEDRVSLWYITNTRRGHTGDFDPSKPVILMIHPLFLDSTWLAPQFEDPRLSAEYNIIAIDLRSSGYSDARPSPQHDTWVDAADLAFALMALGLPPVHVFAIQTISVNAALRLAALFPELCLSLTLVNAPPPTELQWVFNNFEELLNLWCQPQDLNEFDHALLQLTNHFLGQVANSKDYEDELIAFWSLRYPPWRRTRVYDLMHCLLNREALGDNVLACIRQPTLIIQGDSTDMSPLRYAEELKAKLVNAEGGARVHTHIGGPEYVTVVRGCASVVNRIFAQFLRQQPKSKTAIPDPYIKTLTPSMRRQRMQEALKKLSDLFADSDICERDPSSALSFSCVSAEVLQSQREILQRQMLDEHKAFSPLGMDGRPCRRFSDRSENHWFLSDRDDRISGTLSEEQKLKAFDNMFTHKEIASATSGQKWTHFSAQEPVSSEVARTGRLRRSTISKHIVEQHAMNGNGGGFAPTLIQNTLLMSRLRL